MGVPWAVYRYQIEEGTQHTRAVCGSHNRAGRVEARLKMVGTVVCRASDHAPACASRDSDLLSHHHCLLHLRTIPYPKYAIITLDFKYHTAINNGHYNYIDHHCPIYIMAVSEVIECGSFTFKTQVVTEMPSAGPHVKLETTVKMRKTSANLEFTS